MLQRRRGPQTVALGRGDKVGDRPDLVRPEVRVELLEGDGATNVLVHEHEQPLRLLLAGRLATGVVGHLHEHSADLGLVERATTVLVRGLEHLLREHLAGNGVGHEVVHQRHVHLLDVLRSLQLLHPLDAGLPDVLRLRLQRHLELLRAHAVHGVEPVLALRGRERALGLRRLRVHSQAEALPLLLLLRATADVEGDVRALEHLVLRSDALQEAVPGVHGALLRDTSTALAGHSQDQVAALHARERRGATRLQGLGGDDHVGGDAASDGTGLAVSEHVLPLLLELLPGGKRLQVLLAPHGPAHEVRHELGGLLLAHRLLHRLRLRLRHHLRLRLGHDDLPGRGLLGLAPQPLGLLLLRLPLAGRLLLSLAPQALLLLLPLALRLVVGGPPRGLLLLRL
eukprot:Rhum_TRINITY_DN15076_c7_g2::Rhum_TRINITY_DN15076_c7_g2_i1::g.136779::m.136779